MYPRMLFRRHQQQVEGELAVRYTTRHPRGINIWVNAGNTRRGFRNMAAGEAT